MSNVCKIEMCEIKFTLIINNYGSQFLDIGFLHNRLVIRDKSPMTAPPRRATSSRLSLLPEDRSQRIHSPSATCAILGLRRSLTNNALPTNSGLGSNT